MNDHGDSSQPAKSSEDASEAGAGLYSKSPFAHVVEGYERSLFLGPFLEAGRDPVVTDVEIAVCFADLRGFTKYIEEVRALGQDSRAHAFLRPYFLLYPKAVLEIVYALEPKAGATSWTQNTPVRELIVPSSYKNLGDGMMLVWELRGERAIDDAVAGRILQTITVIQRLFTRLIADESKRATAPYAKAVSGLRLGFGLARGAAWRLDFGRQRSIDYAGRVLNLAARLQDMARPEGIVADLGFCDPVFSTGQGQQTVISLKGIDKPVDVWATDDVVLSSVK